MTITNSPMYPNRSVLHGLDSAKPTPNVGDVYLATDTKSLYTCYVIGDWEVNGILSGLLADRPTGRVGDLYITTDTDEVFKCSSVGVWALNSELAAHILLETIHGRVEDVINLGASSVKSLSLGGALTKTGSFHEVGAYAGDTDGLVQIMGGTPGDLLVLHPTSGDTITVTANSLMRLHNGSNFVMTNVDDTIVLICKSSSVWVEVSRSLWMV